MPEQISATEQDIYLIPREDVYRTPVSRTIISRFRLELPFKGFTESRSHLFVTGTATAATIARFEDTVDDLARQGARDPILDKLNWRTQTDYQDPMFVKGRAVVHFPEGTLRTAVDINETEERERYRARFTFMTDHRGYRVWYEEAVSSKRTPRTKGLTEVAYTMRVTGFTESPEPTEDLALKLWNSCPPYSRSLEKMPRIVGRFLDRKSWSLITNRETPTISEKGVQRVIRRMHQAERNRTSDISNGK